VFKNRRFVGGGIHYYTYLFGGGVFSEGLKKRA
jgi:hypothetical protein